METLTYDNLPAGSAILRWRNEDGALVIFAPAVEQSGPIKSRAAQRAALHAMWVTVVIFLIVFLFTLSLSPPRNAARLLDPVILFLATVCFAAMFALLWQERWRNLRDKNDRGLSEQTILAMRPGELRIETKGPRRELSLVLQSNQIVDVVAINDFVQRHPDHLMLRLGSGESILLLVGRAPAEVEWVAMTVRQTMNAGERA